MGRWGRDSVLNQGPGRLVLRSGRGSDWADEHRQRWLVIINDDLDAFFDDGSRITGVGVEGFRPTANLQGYLPQRARSDASSYPPGPSDHRMRRSGRGTWLGGCRHALFTWR